MRVASDVEDTQNESPGPRYVSEDIQTKHAKDAYRIATGT